jgi:hypothetical protein
MMASMSSATPSQARSPKKDGDVRTRHEWGGRSKQARTDSRASKALRRLCGCTKEERSIDRTDGRKEKNSKEKKRKQKRRQASVVHRCESSGPPPPKKRKDDEKQKQGRRGRDPHNESCPLAHPNKATREVSPALRRLPSGGRSIYARYILVPPAHKNRDRNKGPWRINEKKSPAPKEKEKETGEAKKLNKRKGENTGLEGRP